jgi:hypothetical protein
LTRFFDTSALAKRYISEPGSELVRAALRSRQVTVARIAHAELAASVARAWRLGALAEAQRDAILTRLADDFSRLNIVEIRAAVVGTEPDSSSAYSARAPTKVTTLRRRPVSPSGAPGRTPWDEPIGP